MYFASPGGFRRCCQSRCFTLVTSLEPASDNNSSTSSWRWKIGTEKMPEKTRRFFSPEKKLLLWSSSASRRVFTWNWKFEIQDVNLFGRFTGNRWWITCWFGLMWSRQYLFDLTRFRQYLWITALGGIMWEPSILLINGSWEFISIFWISLQNGFSVHRALPWTSAGDLPQTGQHWKPEKKHARTYFHK